MRCCIDSVVHRPTVHQPSSIRNTDHHRTVCQPCSIQVASPSVGSQIGHAGRVQRTGSRIDASRTADVTHIVTAIGREDATDITRSRVPLGAAVSRSGHRRIVAAATDYGNQQSQR